MRGRRAFVVLTVYLLLMSGIIGIIYLGFAASAGNPFGPQPRDVGKAVFAAVVGVQVFLVLFVGPAFTAGAITGEKERQTYDLLRTTLLSPRQIVSGKLFSALSYVLLLVFASIPLQSIAFLLGGVALQEVLLSQLLIIVSAVAFALIGLFASSFMRSTLSATVATYAATILLIVGLPLLALLIALFTDGLSFGFARSPVSWILEALLIYFMLFMAALNLPAALVTSEVILLEENTLWGFTEMVGGHRVFVFSPWYLNLILFSLLALFLYFLTVRRVSKIAIR